MPLVQAKIYTEEAYYNLPENVRAELIEGNLIYNQAAPSRIHQAVGVLLSDFTTFRDCSEQISVFSFEYQKSTATLKDYGTSKLSNTFNIKMYLELAFLRCFLDRNCQP